MKMPIQMMAVATKDKMRAVPSSGHIQDRETDADRQWKKSGIGKAAERVACERKSETTLHTEYPSF